MDRFDGSFNPRSSGIEIAPRFRQKERHIGAANGEMPPLRAPGDYRPPVHESFARLNTPETGILRLLSRPQDPETTKAASGIPGGLHALTALRWAAYESASGLAISRLVPGTDA